LTDPSRSTEDGLELDEEREIARAPGQVLEAR